MELAQGDMFSYINKREEHGLGLDTKVSLSIAENLAVMHNKGFVHGDFKLENVLVLRDGTTKIADFASSYKPERDPPRNIYTKEMISYERLLFLQNSPSTRENKTKQYDPFKDDIFALGCTLYEQLYIASPMRNEKGEIAKGVFEELNKGDAFSKAIAKMLGPEAERPANGTEALKLLKEAIPEEVLSLVGTTVEQAITSRSAHFTLAPIPYYWLLPR